MGQIQVLILSCIFFIMILQGVNANEIYTPNSYTTCDEKSCTSTTYSIPRYAQENKEWKEIEDVKSLKDKGVIQLNVLEEDKEFPLEIIDYNLTSITLELKKWAIFNTPIPVRIWDKTENITDKDFKDKLKKVKEEEVIFNIFDLGKEIRTYDFNVGDVLEFGYNSTSITFNYTFEYVGATIRHTNPDDSYNALTLMNISNQNYGRHAIVGFNISLGDYTQIDNAEMGFYISENLIDFGESLNVSTHHIYSWANVSTNVSWNTAPTAITEWNLTPTHTNFYNNTILNVVTRFNVTEAMRNEHSNKTFTAFLRSTHSGVNVATGTLDYITFLNRLETGDIDNYPYLNITYSAVADETNPNSITNLVNLTNEWNGVYLNWTNPPTDFNSAIIYRDSINIINTSNGYYNDTGITNDTTYVYTIHTKDNAGNINNTDVNLTVTTGEQPTPPDTTPPTFTTIPNNITQEVNISIGSLFKATDLSGIDTFKINWTNTFSMNSSGYLVNNSITPIGFYRLNVSVNDTIGNTNSLLFTINITDVPPPPTPSNVTTSCGLNYSGLIIGNSTNNNYIQLCKGDNFFR